MFGLFSFVCGNRFFVFLVFKIQISHTVRFQGWEDFKRKFPSLAKIYMTTKHWI
jgi:hypothetical protein